MMGVDDPRNWPAAGGAHLPDAETLRGAIYSSQRGGGAQ